jgi:hypothetical protein
MYVLNHQLIITEIIKKGNSLKYLGWCEPLKGIYYEWNICALCNLNVKIELAGM